MAIPDQAALQRTPFHDLHLAAGAKMVPFAGWSMPIQYAAGIIQEHLHTRSQAGLFDVSHMGQIDVTGSGACAWLESLTTADLAALPPGRQTYSLLPNTAGGLIDDLMIQRLGDGFHVVCNASRCADVLAWLTAHPPGADCSYVLREDLVLLALQGPLAESVLQPHADVAGMRFLDVRTVSPDGVALRISRSGYTGEDGFEISLPVTSAASFAQRLLDHENVRWTGLGARDTLRLEAGMCLYGNDIDDTTTPVSAAIGWAVGAARRAGGARAGGFPGAAVVLGEFQEPPARVRVGLLPDGRAPQRAGTPLLGADGREVGVITSGNHSPTLGRPVAMGYLDRAVKLSGEALHIDSRGQSVSVSLTSMPFVPTRYLR
ncbi:glycine cleavage system aminomethyltransferase GcvT [Methyloversatilis sp.]|uniref:glycine cleavage system aminomethyltransferase GcvT n=1 Tax=Methyloversatilis sp. TaxID=2569862 RepID=UPI0027370CF2|nr:glycine cleavage system aminomethyltransferase GcvT [Methyloversatilis sp.]MDP2867281.1 glycine cleavage system aminomethyltransferase GcvT [Methyloversatilis sp.]MDP3456720.1 glycine cleavage system aminomethyltransferase GcvT [Methyloversatilis sp.]MDP3576956.1 glycine cleavage system aminomethyltransferase GcvT [Methyloversatilis sp.]